MHLHLHQPARAQVAAIVRLHNAMAADPRNQTRVVRSPQAQALASRLFRKRVKPSGKNYTRKDRNAKVES